MIDDNMITRRGEDFAMSDGLAMLTCRATSRRTDYATMSGHSWLRTRSSRWRVRVLGECGRPEWYPSRTRYIAGRSFRSSFFPSDVTWFTSFCFLHLTMLANNAAKANSSAEMVTAPKVKIVACKSGDAVDGKKGKGD